MQLQNIKLNKKEGLEMSTLQYKEGNIVLHPKMDWGRGIVRENSDGKTVQVVFEKVGTKKLALTHIELMPLNMEEVLDVDFKRMEINNKIYVDTPFVDIFSDIKSKYPKHLVIIENGCYYEVLYDDAQYLSSLYGWTVYERQHKVPMTGFPDTAKNIWNDLASFRKPYLIVSQLPNSSNYKIKRKIAEVHNG